VDYLYSLYDALVSINVPSDKARAVVDAMERDMGTTLATKQDLEQQRLATKHDLELVRLSLSHEIELLRRDMEDRFAVVDRRFVGVDQKFAGVDQKFDALAARFDQKLDALELRMTVKLGSMLIVGFGLTIAAFRLWS
jgi:hypothetical protein